MKWRWSHLFGSARHCDPESRTSERPSMEHPGTSVEYPPGVRKNRRFVPAAIRAAVVTEKPGDFIFDPDSGR
jgi:hypothetical protein